MFELGADSTPSQLLGKRTAEEAFCEIPERHMERIMPDMIGDEEGWRKQDIDQNWSELCCTKKREVLPMF